MATPRTFLISIAKFNSVRCPHKLTRPVGHTTLIDRHLQLMQSVPADSRIFACGDWAPRSLAQSYRGIHVTWRTDVSVLGATFGDLWSWALGWDIQDSDKVIWLNPCCPFLRAGTIISAVRKMDDIDQTWGVVVPTYTIETPFWKANGKPFSRRRLPSSTANQMMALSHAYWMRWGSGFRMACEEPGALGQQHQEAITVPIEQIEAIDVDTEADLLIADAVATKLRC